MYLVTGATGTSAKPSRGNYTDKGITSGHSVNITDDVENITGTAPATFREWCERHAGAFR